MTSRSPFTFLVISLDLFFSIYPLVASTEKTLVHSPIFASTQSSRRLPRRRDVRNYSHLFFPSLFPPIFLSLIFTLYAYLDPSFYLSAYLSISVTASSSARIYYIFTSFHPIGVLRFGCVLHRRRQRITGSVRYGKVRRATVPFGASSYRSLPFNRWTHRRGRRPTGLDREAGSRSFSRRLFFSCPRPSTGHDPSTKLIRTLRRTVVSTSFLRPIGRRLFLSKY